MHSLIRKEWSQNNLLMRLYLEVALLSALSVSLYASVVELTEDVSVGPEKGLLLGLLLKPKPDLLQHEIRSKCPPDEVYECDLPCREQCDYKECFKRRIHDQCQKRCYCRPEYVRINNRCISRHEACREPSHICPDHSTWRKGSSCTDQCHTHNRYCHNERKMGCFCDEGYAMIQEKCRPKDYCNCGQNAMFQTCGNPCDQLCPYPPSGCYRPVKCLEGCFCVQNFVSVNGTCLSPEDAGCAMPTRQSTTVSTPDTTTTEAAIGPYYGPDSAEKFEFLIELPDSSNCRDNDEE